MTLGQIKSYVWSMVDDLNGDYFTTAELTRYANQMLRECQKLLIQSGNNWYVQIDATQSTVINQANYTLPTDFLKINRLELVQNPGTNETRYAVQNIPLAQKDSIAFDSDVAAFYILKSTLYLTPLPQTVKTIRIYYTYRVAEMTSDSDTPDLPSEFHEYLADRIAETCFLKDGRDASFIRQRCDQVEQYMKADAIERSQVSASRVVIVDDDGGFG